MRKKPRSMEQKLKKASSLASMIIWISMEQMKNMGGLSKTAWKCFRAWAAVSSSSIEDAMDEKKMAQIEAMILSMTPKERANPDLLNPSRKKRIAAGAGVDISRGEQAGQTV